MGRALLPRHCRSRGPDDERSKGCTGYKLLHIHSHGDALRESISKLPPPSIVPDPKLFNSHLRCPDQILDAVRASYKKGGAGKGGAGGDTATISPISCASLAALVLIAGRQISLRYTTDDKGLQDKSQRIMPWRLNA